MAATAQTAPVFLSPQPVSSLPVKLHPGYHHIAPPRIAAPAALPPAAVATLPAWQGKFVIGATTYHYTITGAAPAGAVAANIPTIIVPIKLTISDYSLDGKTPMVLDATPIVSHVLGSPIFTASSFATGKRQFGDAMLHAEFPTASASWATNFTATVGATLPITIAKGKSKVVKAASGAHLATINDDTQIDNPILAALDAGTYPANSFIVFVTYNALEHDAFGYHSDESIAGGTKDVVYTYTSWLEGVNDAFSTPSPNATTLSHEIAETIHDPFGTSQTKKWGDPFSGNTCMDTAIETGDAIENAPAATQLWKQNVAGGPRPGQYTLQSEALLQWFERQTPSSATGGAYSFPSLSALTQAAAKTCVP